MSSATHDRIHHSIVTGGLYSLGSAGHKKEERALEKIRKEIGIKLTPCLTKLSRHFLEEDTSIPQFITGFFSIFYSSCINYTRFSCIFMGQKIHKLLKIVFLRCWFRSHLRNMIEYTYLLKIPTGSVIKMHNFRRNNIMLEDRQYLIVQVWSVK